MVKSLKFLIAMVAVMVLQGQLYASTIFVANLTGSQENPAVTTSAFGSAVLDLNAAQTQLTIDIEIVGLDLGPAAGTTPQTASLQDDLTNLHIHNAPAGLNGGVVFGMVTPNHDINPPNLVITPSGTGVGGLIQSIWDIPEGNGTTLTLQLPNLFADLLYINAHTNAHPGGEIRG